MNAAISIVLKEQFNIIPTSISNLEGYDSVNFKILSNQGTFVLKQYSNTKSIKELLLAENAVLQHLSTLKNQEFPEAIQSIDGNLLWSDKTNTYRLLTYLEGDFLGDVTHSPALLSSFGAFLANLNRKLENEKRPKLSRLFLSTIR